MSLSISSNNVSPASNLKSSGDPISTKDIPASSEEAGFFDTLKNALAGSNSDEKQKLDGSEIKNDRSDTASTSVADNAPIPDAALAASDDDGEMIQSDTDVAPKNNSSASQAEVKPSKASEHEVEDSSEQGVNKMALVAGTTSAEIDSHAKQGTSGAHATEWTAQNTPSQEPSSDKSPVKNTNAQHTMDESAQLLSRLDESNKALKAAPTNSVDSSEQAFVAAGVATTASKDSTVIGEERAINASEIAASNDVTRLVDGQALNENAAQAVDDTAPDVIVPGTVTAVDTPTSSTSIQSTEAVSQTGKAALAASSDGTVKADTSSPLSHSTQNQPSKSQSSQIVWSQADTSNEAKLEGKASLLAAGASADKSMAQLSAQAQAQAQTSGAATNIPPSTLPASGSHEGAAVTGTLAAASLMANKDPSHAVKASVDASLLGTKGIAGTNPKGLKPTQTLGSEPLNGLTQASAAGAALGTQALRADQAQGTTNVQSPLVLTKENASDQVSERIQMMMAKNLKQIDIRLDPPELGRMQIRMTLNSDSATVHFTVQNQQTREMVDQSMPRLREMLSQQGIQLADTSVQQQNSGQQQRHASHGPQDQTSSGVGSAQGDSDTMEEGVTMTANISKKEDGISYYA
ncbi:flagellar hook-length control protein FliK [Vibrio sp. 10N.261.51.F12]|uniref:flagellar hook-length control protein FliK n=1 Tax=Vibrio sp. 10N.261.51.F12 TaxID=3229679 RepID=UPI00354CD220